MKIVREIVVRGIELSVGSQNEGSKTRNSTVKYCSTALDSNGFSMNLLHGTAL